MYIICFFFFLNNQTLLLSDFIFIYLFIYLWLCWVFVSARGLSLGCGKWGPLFISVRGPLVIVASPVAEHRLQTRRLSNCGSRAQQLCSMWDLPRPGPEPGFPALAGRFSTTAPPGKPPNMLFYIHNSVNISKINIFWGKICPKIMLHHFN